MPDDDTGTRKRVEPLARAPADLVYQALTLASEDTNLESVVGHVLASISDIMGAASSAIFLLDEDHEAAVMRWVWRDGTVQSGKNDRTHPSGGRPVPKDRLLSWEERFGAKACPYLINLASHPEMTEDIRSWARLEGYSSILAVPLRPGEKIIGSLSLRFKDGRQVDSVEIDLAQSLAHQAALVLELAQRAEEKEAAAVLEERNRLAGVLHDTIAQGLSVIILRLDMAMAKLGQEASLARGHLETAAKIARETLSEARRSVWELGGAAREERDLVLALNRLAQEGSPAGGVRIATRIDGAVPELPYRISDNLFQIAREAVANALRHADARTITVALNVNSSEVRLQITDDGRGFVTLPKAVRRGFGLDIMERRAKSLGGEFSIASRLGEGVSVAVRLPIAALNV
jgi:two-component system, NarL family, sensor kinase